MSRPKAPLIADIIAVTDEILGLAVGTAKARLCQPVYAEGWNVRQVYSHLASFDCARLLGNWLRQARGVVATSKHVFDAQEWNQREVAARQERTLAELLTEIAERRAALVAAVAVTAQEELDLPIETASGMRGTVGDVLYAMAVEHEREHLVELQRALTAGAS